MSRSVNAVVSFQVLQTVDIINVVLSHISRGIVEIKNMKISHEKEIQSSKEFGRVCGLD